MIRRGNCCVDAAMESFWSTLKLEPVYLGRSTSHRHAWSEIFEFIEVFYNRQCRHTSLSSVRFTEAGPGYLSGGIERINL